jgi:hypothetical protein
MLLNTLTQHEASADLYAHACCPVLLQVPQFTLPPQPWQVGWKLQDGTRVNKDLYQLLIDMLTQMNKATATLPTLESVTQ